MGGKMKAGGAVINASTWNL